MKRSIRLLLIQTAIAFASVIHLTTLPCQAVELPSPPADDPELAALLQPLIEAHQGKVGVAIKHLGTGKGYLYRGDQPMPTASLIKMAVMVAAYHQIDAGTIDATVRVELKESDKVPGSGILTGHFSAGTNLSLRDTIRLMMAFSDNTATNLVVDVIGLTTTSELMKSFGLPNTQLHSKVYRRDTSIDLERSQRFGLGSTTAAETIALLEWIDRGEIIDRKICDEMLAHLYANQDATKLARSLPTSVRIGHKSGYVNASRTDAGLIDGPNGRIAICVLTDENVDRSPGDDNAAHQLIGNVAKVAYQHFYPTIFSGQSDGKSDSPNHLRVGASGAQVQTLQRALNDRLVPSPQLAVDGDFGPATEEAVKRFQESSGLAATGIVDDAARMLLEMANGTPAPVAATAANVAAAQPEPPPKRTESLDGPPVVSCKSWAIANAETGEVLFENLGGKRRDNASTTKLMTAWLVAKLAAADPGVLKEVIAFSQRADETIGSTAAVSAGERVVVGDLLYGLLLPSGNDASVALAEHFGRRFIVGGDLPDAQLSAEASYDRFIEVMNAEAKTLGLDATSFENPHGLTEDGHGASAIDLCRLAVKVLHDPILSPIVSTRRYVCHVQTANDEKRELVWENTNRLLEIEGYDGLKTGTTTAAGACLVASGNRDGKRLVVVVLGSSGSDARYADSRNLFRWAWREIEKR